MELQEALRNGMVRAGPNISGHGAIPSSSSPILTLNPLFQGAVAIGKPMQPSTSAFPFARPGMYNPKASFFQAPLPSYASMASLPPRNSFSGGVTTVEQMRTSNTHMLYQEQVQGNDRFVPNLIQPDIKAFQLK
ncbi:hypothetical protein GOP47_0008109 [Adiantum capillus-veneris]|uniref:Uncharacterized protein n=1 Tax=Adiantum capillus-veneris TaxID=13818 RepID=A0A9D4ZHV7_ADICA|nr:hypothetical protein GOP47_0008109 [Adiantum capillus-veneris]